MSAYSSTYDILFGTLLLLLSFLGTLFNIFSFHYFITRPSSSGNVKFFHLIYVSITLTDTLICVSMLPVIEAAFSADRQGAMFTNEHFCFFWTILWTLLPQLSVFMVGVLSLSRLVLLMRKSVRINPRIAILLPVLCVTWTISSSLLLVFGVDATQRYYTNWLGCSYTTFAPDDMLRELVPQDLTKGLVMRVVLNVIPGASPLPITVSFLLTMCYLRESIKCAERSAGSSKRQIEATKTVILVTFAYIILNIPYVSSLVFFLSIWTTPEPGITVAEYEKGHALPDTLFMGTYLIALTTIACLCINSFINPLLYFWRMKSFRHHVLRQRSSFIHSLVSKTEQNEMHIVPKRNNRVSITSR